MADDGSVLDSLDELDDFSDSGSDYEATMKSKKRRKQPVLGLKPPKRSRRKAALRVSSSPSPPDSSLQQQQHSRGTSRQASPRPVGSVNTESQGISAEDLYDAVYSGKSAMVTVVDEWLDSYKQSREAGLLVLINFIVRSCGCKGVVSREMFDSMQNADIIRTLTKEFNEDSVAYPLCTPGPQLRRFKNSLSEFVRVLVCSCQNSLIYDEFLFPSLLALLTGLSDSQVRAFRHTSTLLAMKLMTGLVGVALIVSVQLQTTQRRYDMENSNRTNARALDQLEKLQASISELQEMKEEVSSMMNATFRGVFVHRYRDCLPDIRAACIEELGVWLKTDPEGFLNDGCLKYLGWTLYDKQGPVRLQCVRALQGLYQEKEFIGRLELFTSRFKERMLSMVLDKDLDVAMEAVSLLLLIHQSTEEGLKEEECGQIYPLVYTSHRGLASAAGAFLYSKLKSVITSEDRRSDKSDHAAFFQILITFYIQSEFHEHGAYLVDSLWSVAGSELKDWETMTALLLQESGLMYEEEGALIELMMCAIRQASQATPPVGRVQGKKILSMKDKKTQEQDRRRITSHLNPLLPQLLAKYSADASKVSLLLKAPLYFNLEMYNSTPTLEKHLDLLLSQICRIVEKHTNVTVLEACAHLASALCTHSYTFSSRAHLAFSQLLDDLTECFSTYLNDLLQGTADDDDIYSAAAALKRIAAMSSARDVTACKLFDSCMELLKSRIESGELDMELTVSALKCAAFHLMWAKVNAVNSIPAEAELKHLKKEVKSFCRVCQACLSVNQAEMRDQAFELLCDLLLLYSTSSVRSEPALQTLVHLPSDSLRSEMAAFLLDYIFSDSEDAELNDEGEEETRLTLLRRKRNQLAGYCKLVIYGVLDLSAATDVIKHYSKYFKDFGDIIKEMVSKSKLISPVQSAKTVCLSLQQLFSEMLTENYSRQDLNQIRELAKKLAMSFGIDLQRIQKPLMALHMDGIRFAFRGSQEGEEEHRNVTFLEILSEFSFKMLPTNRTQLVRFLKSECPDAALSWPSVRMYQRSLEGRSSSKVTEHDRGGDAPSSLDTPAAKRLRTSAKGSASSMVRGPWLDSSSLSSLHTPALTSTTLKQPDKQPAARKLKATELDNSSTLTESEDDFSSLSQMRKVKPIKRSQLSSSQSRSTGDQQDLHSHLTLLSLIEDEDEEGGEIESYESDSDHESGYVLPSTRHNSTSILDELFD
ncbi:cohesin subunit SA-1 [Cheilinus undulatus]|uniref:cohesin subunit SA-1 n=1 Tax=Cheilinus undulatus TaxID=241271 RepID=UPI001BD2C276|nr:cohesin subunit SA-1 [Cheilinus undulatus]XP_041652999.1 cohesin subunit SA-1 [Cheilinus undulatus]XP_041653000.1 cohesin subunit SA-1 [Cheilinus undulatus]